MRTTPTLERDNAEPSCVPAGASRTAARFANAVPGASRPTPARHRLSCGAASGQSGRALIAALCVALVACGDDHGGSRSETLDAGTDDGEVTDAATSDTTSTDSSTQTESDVTDGTDEDGTAPEGGATDEEAGTAEAGAPEWPAAYPSEGPLSTIAVDRGGSFDENAADDVRFHPQTGQAFVVDGSLGAVRVLQLDADGNLSPIGQLDPASDVGEDFDSGGVRSVAIGAELVAVAVRAAGASDPGRMAVYEADGLTYLGSIELGISPAMLTFIPGRDAVVVACAGEQERDDTDLIVEDPPGSIDVIDLSGGVDAAEVTSLNFDGFDEHLAELKAKGVRVHALSGDYFVSGEGEVSVSSDLEPEHVAIAPDGSSAFVTLQENNAFAVVSLPADLSSAELLDLLPLGVKDHARGQPALQLFEVESRPVLGTLPGESAQEIQVGGFSGLWYAADESTEAGKIFYAISDRGPTAALSDINTEHAGPERPHLLPDYTASIQRLIFDLEYGVVYVDANSAIPLFRADGTTPITGRANDAQLDADEFPVDALGNALEFDPFGADFEGLLVDPTDGSWWLSDEYRPALYNFTATGELIERFVPAGTAAAASGSPPAGAFGSETLPAEYASRGAGRGFEAIALDTDEQVVYAFIQTPLANPDVAASDASLVIRVLGIDADKESTTFGEPVHEYVYLLEAANHATSKVDSIGDAVYAGDGKFLVVERDSSIDARAKKGIFEVALTGATDLLTDAPVLADGMTLEQHTPDMLAERGITPVSKVKLVNPPSLGYFPGDKTEGIAVLEDGSIVLLNDDGYGLTDDEATGDGNATFATQSSFPVLGVISFNRGNGIDASDEDGEINISPWPVYGMYMPNAVASYEVDEATFYVSANEGTHRGYDRARLGTLALDDVSFSDEALQEPQSLGRLQCSALDGDWDADGDHDRVYAFGGRSFSIWDEYGNLVWDSGDLLEQLVAEATPEHFNASATENDFDTRSDDQGPQPAAVTVGEVDARPYAFVGLAQVGGIVIFDVSNPRRPVLIDYVNARDFDAELPSEAAGDLGPRGLEFVAADDSPTGEALLLVGNRVSGTTTLYQLDL